MAAQKQEGVVVCVGGKGGVGWTHVEDGESSGGITNTQVCYNG